MSEIKQNILYITRDRIYLHHDHEVLKVREDGKDILSIPLHHLEGITFFSYSSISPSLLHHCLEKGIFVSFLTPRGKFLGRLEGSRSGNVLLRKEQFKKSEDPDFRAGVARYLIAGKLQNSRSNLLRSGRESKNEEDAKLLKEASDHLQYSIKKLEFQNETASIRGYEGEGAKTYFSVFDKMIIQQKEDFNFLRRTKRPPRSRTNALLSFIYALLTNDCVSACQATGLDPFVGFLHDERSGRPSLALDLMEEFRPFADRFVLSLINRKQIQAKDIKEKPGSVYQLEDGARKYVIAAYQERKKAEIFHHTLDQNSTIGELPFLQARILARHIRGDLENYIPYLWK